MMTAKRVYRMWLAKLNYSEKDADPQNEALLTQEERDNLDAYLVRKRWAKLCQVRRCDDTPMRL